MITSRSLCRGVDLADSVRALRSKALASAAVNVSSERPRPFWSSSGRLLRSVARSVPVLPCTMWIPSGPLSSGGGLQKRRLPWPGLHSPGSSSSVWINCKSPGSPTSSGPCPRGEQVGGWPQSPTCHVPVSSPLHTGNAGLVAVALCSL